MIDAWLNRTPEHFKFAAKIPRLISHQKGMVDCRAEMDEFLYVMRGLGNRLGPLLMQFAYVALVLNHYYTMPDLVEMRQRLDPQTTDFLYVRFLGDRRKMDDHVEELIAASKKEKHWDRIVWERRAEVETWAQNIKEMVAQRPGIELFVFFNNHFAGYAPGTLAHFAQAWKDG